MKIDKRTEYLILLNSVKGLGYGKLQSLLNEGKELADIVSSFKENDFYIKNIEKELQVIDKDGISIVTVFDDEYPKSLREISSPPLLLYIKGSLECLRGNVVGIVGSRTCTYYGKSMVRYICVTLGKLDIAVVSGMARGIDTTAHKEIILSGGKTVAVLGSGLKSIYPFENKNLFFEIASHGAVISEFSLNTPPLRENFPRRNRIISGLSDGIIVIEAPLRSGSLITTDFALSQGKEIFVVPGRANSYHSKGSNKLIKEGAKLVENGIDVVEDLFPDIISSRLTEPSLLDKTLPDSLSDVQKKIYSIISDEPASIDELTDSLNMNSQDALSTLLALELTGLVKQLPGKLFIRK